MPSLVSYGSCRGRSQLCMHQTPFHRAQVLCSGDYLQGQALSQCTGWAPSAAHLSHQPLGRSHQRKLPQLLQQINSTSGRKSNPVIICCLSFHTHAWRKLPPVFWGRGRAFMLREYQETWINCLERTHYVLSWKGRLTLPTAGRQLLFPSSRLW